MCLFILQSFNLEPQVNVTGAVVRNLPPWFLFFLSVFFLNVNEKLEHKSEYFKSSKLTET